MPNPHPRPWHSGSVFSDGPRHRLDREQRARFRFLLNAHRRARHLTPNAELVGSTLLRRLGTDGQLDPTHDRLASDVGCCPRTVRRALATLKMLGLVVWQCRIARSGDCINQISNAYVLIPVAGAVESLPLRKKDKSLKETCRFDGHIVRRLDSREKPLRSLAQIAAERTRQLGLGGTVIAFPGVSA